METAAPFFNPLSLLLVAGGSVLIAAFGSTRRDLARAVKSLKPLFRSRGGEDELAASRAMLQIECLSELKGIACADRVESQVPYVRKAALKLADAPSADAFAEWAAEELEMRAVRHGAVIGVWRSAADAAPNMGMIGTVLGLISMFASMDDPAAMGPGMALAMLTTLYGLLLGTVLFGSVAARLERLSLAELGWQRSFAARLEKLARTQASTTGEWLKRRSKAAQ